MGANTEDWALLSVSPTSILDCRLTLSAQASCWKTTKRDRPRERESRRRRPAGFATRRWRHAVRTYITSYAHTSGDKSTPVTSPSRTPASLRKSTRAPVPHPTSTTRRGPSPSGRHAAAMRLRDGYCCIIHQSIRRDVFRFCAHRGVETREGGGNQL